MIRVLQPGLLSTLQDLGRQGFRRFGVPSGGAADTLSHTLANLVVGNTPAEPTLEMTLTGAVLAFESVATICICGADMQASIRGRRVPMWSPVTVQAGETLVFQAAVRGCRTYLAVTEGFDTHTVMGSGSTNVRAGFGGLDGRPLRPGDLLRVRDGEVPCANRIDTSTTGFSASTWAVSPSLRWHVDGGAPVHVMSGEHHSQFSSDSWRRMMNSEYLVSPQSDRMGIRLSGESLVRTGADDIVSFGVAPGTIQVPPNGQPVVLMADAQVTGGYPVIAHVASVDLPLLAQRRPGQTVRFEETSLEAAQHSIRARDGAIRQLRAGISWKPLIGG